MIREGGAVIEIPGYSIVGQIGKGGMATVYHARQVLLDRDVALKVMSPQLAQDPAYAQRFLQEARMLASLNHPHVVQVYDIGVSPGGLNYFSMQMLQGGDFVDRLRDGLSEEELVRVLVAVAQALGFAHARGYVHRDVTPGNIMFDSHSVPVLTDFGIARALTSTSRITSSGLSIGTSHYMSPEQARGIEVDGRSDIYSLGVVTYEALVGTPPYDGEDGFAVAFAHVHDAIPRLPEEVSRWQPLIDRAMAKDPSQRFPDCDAFVEGIREVAPDEFRSSGAGIQPIPTAPTGKRTKKAASGGPPWRPLALVAAAVLVGLALAVVLWNLMTPSSPGLPTSVSQDKPIPAPPKPVDPASQTPVSPPSDAVPGEGDEDALDLPGETDLSMGEPGADEGEPIPEHTVIDPVVTLIGLGKANIARLRLTAPSVTNALARFKTVFLFEPDNAEAHQGIADIGRAYVKLASEKDPDAGATAAGEWLEFLKQAEDVAALSAVGEPVLRDVARLREERANALMTRADEAVRAWDGATAQRLFAEALVVKPGDDRATRGQQRAAQVGKPGYEFEDAMKDGSNAPGMRVMDGRIAAALRPVTVGEFKRYWNAAGSRAHASEGTRCVDKETNILGLGASSKRSWQSPDVAQDDTHPVVCVSAAMADGYARWLSEQSGKSYRLPKGGELRVGSPTACRENLRDASYRAKEGGRDGADCTDGFAGTAPAGSFPAQGGLFDTGGNVRVWTQDCEAGNCRKRIAIGRSWEAEPTESDRKDFPADTGFNTIGIRVLRDLD